MKAQDDIDFSAIDWSKVDREKAEFIYNEAIARLDSIHRNNDVITNKALSMLSFSVPILTALTGYFVLQWGKLSFPVFAMSVCAGFFLFLIIFLLSLIIVPKEISSAQGEPSAYFTGKYYQNSMENIFKGNIQALHKYIIDDRGIADFRANLFRVAVILFAAFPVITTGVWIIFNACTKN